MQNLNVVILAAGKGTRMHSSLPKVLHKIAGKTLLQHAIDVAANLQAENIQIVIGHGADQIKASVADPLAGFILQEQQLGTGHAVQQALPALNPRALALILYGDVPLITHNTLKKLLALVAKDSMAVLTCDVKNPTGLGRILRNASGNITGIVEQKDASAEQCKITEINSGIMAVPVEKLQQWLPQLTAYNVQNEYYLTDIVSLVLAAGNKVHTLCTNDELEIQGINTRVQLAELERRYQNKIAEQLMHEGITLRDPARFDIRGTLVHGKDIEIDINVIIEGEVTLADDVTIGANCTIRNSKLGRGTRIQENCVIEDCVVGAECQIGPFARIRPGSVLGDMATIGNFVEIKKADIGTGSKVNHLSYIGDATLGNDVNVGAGTITCNYDGVNKHQTIIGNQVFIGSNTALVAPVNISDGATIGAGSVITQNIAAGELAIARQKQRNIAGWVRPKKK